MKRLTIESDYNGRVRAVNIKVTEKLTLAFGVYRWPWINIPGIYKTTAAGIIDTGIFQWITFWKYKKRQSQEIGFFRFLGVGVGFLRKI